MTDAAGVSDAKFTLEMGVDNTGFLVDRLGKDCHPLQFLRELTQNSLEAIQEMPEKKGEIVWDVDWNHYDLTGIYKLACIDTGVGITGADMIKYINHLSSSGHEQAHDKNFGIGAKVAAATRNHAGLVYLSWKDGQGWMSHLWRDPVSGQYGVRRSQRVDGSFQDYARITDDVKPAAIDQHGTMVILFGNDMEQDTVQGPEGVPSPSTWIARYLNTRYFRFPGGITVKARQGWKEPRTNTDVNLLRTVTGQESYINQHAESSGTVNLARAAAHWWILKDELALTQNSGFIASSGHMAALYQDELYEMVTSRAGVARLQLFGVIFGHNRVVIYVEPSNGMTGSLSSNAARTHLLLDEQSLPWTDWAAEFRERMPEEIQTLMAEVVAGSKSQDHRQAIRERLKQIRELFRVSRYRPTPKGALTIAQDTAGGKASENEENTRAGTGGGGGGGGGRAGGIYALFVDESGEAGEEVLADTDPEVQWISTADNTRTPQLLEDRAAKYLVDQNILQINADFRVFTDMIKRWGDRYQEVPGAGDVIESTVHEWFEQALVETVLGAQALQGSPHWTMEDIARLWSEESLTAAVLQRYHIDVNVRRSLGTKLGSLKEKVA